MKNYFIIHGSFGSPYGNWFRWLHDEIEKKCSGGGETAVCYCPQFPTGVGFQNYQNWESLLKTYVRCRLINEETTIFAHSIAPAFVCKFLVKNKIRVKKLVFVCGFNNYFGVSEDYDEVNKTMFSDNFADVKNLCADIVCLYSDNDPYVKFEAEKSFADALTKNQIVVKNGGHLNSAFGYDKFPELLKLL